MSDLPPHFTQLIDGTVVYTADQIHAYARAAVAAERRTSLDAAVKAQEREDALRSALEIIAVGDAENPALQAAEELIALGYWMDIPEARNMATASRKEPK